MAKDPAAIIPFSEGSPADSLKVEELPDGNVLVGDPETEEQPQDSKFEENIALDLSEAVLNNTASELINFYETDRAGRQEWEQRYKDGLKTLDIDGNVVDDDENRAVRGLSQVVHPIIAEAATQFQARAIQELYPAGGPVIRSLKRCQSSFLILTKCFSIYLWSVKHLRKSGMILQWTDSQHVLFRLKILLYPQTALILGHHHVIPKSSNSHATIIIVLSKLVIMSLLVQMKVVLI